MAEGDDSAQQPKRPRLYDPRSPIRQLDERERWWHERNWPMDPAGYTFLARAYFEVGQALHGSLWTGWEPYIEPPRTFSGYEVARKGADRPADLTPVERAFLSEQLARVNREQAEYEADPQGYAERLSVRQRDVHELINQSDERARATQYEIIRLCEAGALKSSWRPLRGGAMTRIPRELWNGSCLYRFAFCQISLEFPFIPIWKGESLGFIFIERRSLDRVLARLFKRRAVQSASPSKTNSGKMSKAISLAVRAIWPDGIPNGLMIKERDWEISRWCRENGHRVPDVRTMRRYFNQ